MELKKALFDHPTVVWFLALLFHSLSLLRECRTGKCSTSYQQSQPTHLV